jgi:hypothetical protein
LSKPTPVKIALWDILELLHQTMILNVSNATRASTTTKMGKYLVLYAQLVLTVLLVRQPARIHRLVVLLVHMLLELRPVKIVQLVCIKLLPDQHRVILVSLGNTIMKPGRLRVKRVVLDNTRYRLPR